MKTSNILIVIFLCSISLLIITGAFYHRFTGSKKGEGAIKQSLPSNIKYVVIKNRGITTINSSESNYFEYYSAQYKLSGDTLFINGSSVISVFIKELKLATAEGGSIELQGIKQNSLELKLANCNFQLNTANAKIGKLSITDHNSRLRLLGNSTIDTIDVNLSNTNANFLTKTKRIQGILNNTEFFRSNAEEVMVKNQNNSQVRINK